jgi:ParB-like nuclease domain
MSDRPLPAASTTASTSSDALSRLLSSSPADDADTALVPIASLKPADSPRLNGVSAGHVQALAETDGELPPILVQRHTMRVIDGMHRVDAARRRGEDLISARFFDGDDQDAFLVGVAANVKHGLPLSLADRRSAAARIIKLRPEASDRWIADLAGVAPKTVAAIRRRLPGVPRQLDRRIGRDGRLRPVSPAEGRRTASQLLTAYPDSSLRQIANNAGISVNTARDVREKLRRGVDPVHPAAPSSGSGRTPGLRAAADRSPAETVDDAAVLERLQRDPAVRYSQTGRTLLRWLRSQRLVTSSDWSDVVSAIPPHCSFDIVRLARGYALTWAEFAEVVDQRTRD